MGMTRKSWKWRLNNQLWEMTTLVHSITKIVYCTPCFSWATKDHQGLE